MNRTLLLKSLLARQIKNPQDRAKVVDKIIEEQIAEDEKRQYDPTNPDYPIEDEQYKSHTTEGMHGIHNSKGTSS